MKLSAVSKIVTLFNLIASIPLAAEANVELRSNALIWATLTLHLSRALEPTALLRKRALLRSLPCDARGSAPR